METPSLGSDVIAETLSRTTLAGPWLSGAVSPKRVHPFYLTLAWPLVLFLTVRSEVSQVSDKDTILRGKVGALRAQSSKSKVPKISTVLEKSVGREQRQIYVSFEADNSIQKPWCIYRPRGIVSAK